MWEEKNNLPQKFAISVGLHFCGTGPIAPRLQKFRHRNFTFLYFHVVSVSHKGWPKGGFYGNKILYKNLDLTQDFPNKILFRSLCGKILPENLPKIFRWPEMCPFGKILGQDFQMAAFTKILGRQNILIAPLVSTEIFRKFVRHSKQKRTQHVWR